MIDKTLMATLQTETGLNQTRRVVHLLGIMPRSGTNYLCDLICMHPDCGRTVHITENFLFAHSQILADFADEVHGSWNMLWGDFGPELKEPLLRALGEGLENYLYGLTAPSWVRQYVTSQEQNKNTALKNSPKICVSRTPSVKNLGLIPRLTDSKIIIIVRDGRSVLESGMRSFGWWYEEAVHRWARAADTILKISKHYPSQILCVRYEDLMTNKAEQLHRIFSFIGADPDIYDFDTEPLVRGSSTFHAGKDHLNWKGSPKTEDFDPFHRWDHWSRAKHARFNRVAGAQLEALGYSPVPTDGLKWKIYNLALDLRWPLWRLLKRTAQKLIPRTLRGKILWNRGIHYRKMILPHS